MLTRRKCGKMWITCNARNRLSIDYSEAPKSPAISGGGVLRVFPLTSLSIKPMPVCGDEAHQVVIPLQCEGLTEPMPRYCA